MIVLTDERGQSLTEYIIIVVLVVIAVIVSFHLFGSTVRDKFFRAGDNMEQSTSESTDSAASSSSTSGTSSSTRPGQPRHEVSSPEAEYMSKIFADEDALRIYEEEKKKAWLKTALFFAVAGAVLLLLIFMTIERIRLIKKQLQLQQDDMDDFRRTRYRKPITFKKRKE
ncbi:hypothetical protein ACFL27_17280 [candidate division CSSED10-310 bacterium]|uniref:Uncharacterized protein n=1 Tax=candidate division CSSED10-310 bacterium TaxID=2855610 RepID=A0ABV6Z0G9_UNCC1